MIAHWNAELAEHFLMGLVLGELGPSSRPPSQLSEWPALLSVYSVGSALSHLLDGAIENLDWFDDEHQTHDVMEALTLANQLAVALTRQLDLFLDELSVDLLHDALDAKGIDPQLRLFIPTALASAVAGRLTDAADRLELTKVYDVCRDEYDEEGLALVAHMRLTVEEIRVATGAS